VGNRQDLRPGVTRGTRDLPHGCRNRPARAADVRPLRGGPPDRPENATGAERRRHQLRPRNRSGSWVAWFRVSGDLCTAGTFVAVPYTIITDPMVFFGPLLLLRSVGRIRGFVTPADVVRARVGSPHPWTRSSRSTSGPPLN